MLEHWIDSISFPTALIELFTRNEVSHVETWNWKKARSLVNAFGLQVLSFSLVLLISMDGTVFIRADTVTVPLG